MNERKLRLKLPILLLFLALGVWAQSASAQGVSPDTVRQTEFGKIMKIQSKPLTADEKLKIVNENLLKANLPAIKIYRPSRPSS